MKNRGDHSINRPGAWTHSGQGVEEVFLYQPRREYVTKKSMEGNYMEKKEIVRQIHVRLEFLSIKSLKLVLSFINGLRS
ncbi:MAG: hypothetical protein ACLUV1_04515 [Evtepia gabavorous]|uniref:hypothetical protein n=1 Tax=Evtepia gabavorous TaxID=2211183 RepID=UPI0020684594|nr:MAG TPA: hypothetical protein [Caudoviricetes sp.]